MKYTMLIYLDEKTLSEQEREQCYRESAQYAQELHSGGRYLAAVPLQPTATATSIRPREDKRMVTDGPFAETREQLAGFFLVEARDLDEAIDIAGKIPAGRWGTVEIRPVVEISGLPSNEGAINQGTVSRGVAN